MGGLLEKLGCITEWHSTDDVRLLSLGGGGVIILDGSSLNGLCLNDALHCNNVTSIL